MLHSTEFMHLCFPLGHEQHHLGAQSIFGRWDLTLVEAENFTSAPEVGLDIEQCRLFSQPRPADHVFYDYRVVDQ